MAAAAMFLISSECYKMGNYNPILMKIGTQTTKTAEKKMVKFEFK
jgi:hypothetical protein